MTLTKFRAAALFVAGVIVLAVAIAADAPRIFSRQQVADAAQDARKDKVWQAVAPGRVEPRTGEVRIHASMLAPIGEVLVKANDQVVAGEPLVRLVDKELQARLASAETQVALRQRARNDQSASGKASERRKAEDAVYEAEKTFAEARSAFDDAAIARRNGTGKSAAFDSTRNAMVRAADRVIQRKADYERIEADAPLPTVTEGQLSIARADLQVIRASIDKLTIRAPMSGSILQVNARTGELAAPSSPQPLLTIGDLSGLRVRAEVDERDFGEIRLGQQVTVRSSAFPDRDFAGKVSFIAPIVQAGSATSRGPGNMADVDVAEVLIDLGNAEPLAVGMKVDVYFRRDAVSAQ